MVNQNQLQLNNIIVPNDSLDYFSRNPVEKETGEPSPFRLVMIKIIDNCQFCTNPKGGVYQYFISIEDKLGFLSCEKCQEKAKEYVSKWMSTKAYGRANKFRNMKFKVRRSSGVIDPNWELSEYPFVDYVQNDECVECVNKEEKIVKMVRIDDLLELNS